jgi:hypothetical protein
MCSYEEWERLARVVHERVDEHQVREFVAGAAARVEALVDELECWACSSQDADRIRGRARRSRREWVA